MLCTDGDFNVGISDRGLLQALVERQRAGDVSLNAYGFGMGNYKDDTRLSPRCAGPGPPRG